MDPMEWEPEYDGEDFSTEWEPEFLPGLPGLPSPSAALARRFFPQRRRPTPTPSRPGVRPVGAPSSVATVAPSGLTAVHDRVRALDDRQKGIATQLAVLQQRSAAQQSSETFGPLATGAVGAFALGLKGGDTFSPLITHGLPVAQLLLASRGRAISSGFRANPWSTLGFPIAAILLTVFRDRIPGLAARTVDTPDVTITPDPTVTGAFIVTVRKPSGSILRFETGTDPIDPTAGSPVFPSVLRLEAGQRFKVRAFVDGVASDVVLVAAPVSV